MRYGESGKASIVPQAHLFLCRQKPSLHEHTPPHVLAVGARQDCSKEVTYSSVANDFGLVSGCTSRPTLPDVCIAPLDPYPPFEELGQWNSMQTQAPWNTAKVNAPLPFRRNPNLKGASCFREPQREGSCQLKGSPDLFPEGSPLFLQLPGHLCKKNSCEGSHHQKGAKDKNTARQKPFIETRGNLVFSMKHN